MDDEAECAAPHASAAPPQACPPQPPLVAVRVRLVGGAPAECDDSACGSRSRSIRLELEEGEQLVRLELAEGSDGAVSAALVVQEVFTQLGSTCSTSTVAAAGDGLAGAEPEPDEAREQDAQQDAADAALQQQHADLLRENQRLQALVRQHLDGISKASRESLLQEAGGAAAGDAAEQRQRYLLALQQLHRLMVQQKAAAAAAAAALAPDQARLAAALEAAQAQRAALLRFVSDVAAAASRAAAAGLPRAALPEHALQHFLEAEPAKAAEGRALRAASASLAHRLAAAERRLKEADQLCAEGLHLVDFEQTRIENATLAAKRETREADVEKLRDKLVQMVQITAHVREKLHCAELERAALAADLETAEAALVVARREQLAAKVDRERLRREWGQLAEDWRIVGDQRCLEDLRRQRAQLEELQAQAAALQAQYEAGERCAPRKNSRAAG